MKSKNVSPLMTDKRYTSLVERAKLELEGSSMRTAFRRLIAPAYSRLHGHFGHGERREHAEDFALQALADAAGAAGRMKEYDQDW